MSLTVVPTILKPTVGRIVHIVLTQEHAAAIKSNPHFRGNAPEVGEVYPLIITRVWPKATYDDGLTINGQLIVDGFDGIIWMTSVHHGDQPGQWRWPQIEHATELKTCAQSEALNTRLHDVTGSAAVTAGRIERLQDELARVRKHETELIQDRDRLIHKDLAQLHKEVDDLKGELENERAARKIYSDRLAKSDSELAAALDRERRLSERLANIASLVSDM